MQTIAKQYIIKVELKYFSHKMINFSLINTSELFGNNLIPTATSSGLSNSFLRENMGKSNLTVGGTMPKMSMSLLRENNSRYVSF